MYKVEFYEAGHLILDDSRGEMAQLLADLLGDGGRVTRTVEELLVPGKEPSITAEDAANKAGSKRLPRPYRPRPSTVQDVLASLLSEEGRTAEEVAKASSIDKATTGKVLAYLEGDGRAVVADGKWRRAVGV